MDRIDRMKAGEDQLLAAAAPCLPILFILSIDVQSMVLGRREHGWTGLTR
jgi:hypothetical protein